MVFTYIIYSTYTYFYKIDISRPSANSFIFNSIFSMSKVKISFNKVSTVFLLVLFHRSPCYPRPDQRVFDKSKFEKYHKLMILDLAACPPASKCLKNL